MYIAMSYMTYTTYYANGNAHIQILRTVKDFAEVVCARELFSYLYAYTYTQWFIDFLFITRDSRKPNKLCGRKTTKQKELTL